ncbi:MAG: DUF2089 domain-containing protein [Anaerolineales bacterium]|jgi:hypothetical protein|nr:DUF2089 domain-containing protein [Anaerolineales bacterium]MCW5838867.1 DUF2089 domain-containing protein [Anaerolineales bacterium]MCW5888012.1 DUF2089 domain-containing protein [Anaerolineales bacterium]
MHSAPHVCPVCQGELVLTRLVCRDCETAIEGRFEAGPFSRLSPEQLHFVEAFVRNEGKITRMEDEFKLSYPTIRSRLHEVIRALGYEPGKDSAVPLTEEERRRILEDLDSGKITSEEAMRMLE